MSPQTAAPQSDASFRQRVLALVARIPEGRVMTYGQLALLAGNSGAARQAGFGDLQENLLRAEGVHFDDSGRCDLTRLQWWPEEKDAPPPSLF